jgi:NAD-dependent SIR2 family protein deacetylase
MAACKDCKKRCKKYVGYCKTCDEKRNNARIDKAIQIVNSDMCPQCGSKIRQNLALAGWFQCEQFGSEGFRKDGNKPSCSWQTFTV